MLKRCLGSLFWIASLEFTMYVIIFPCLGSGSILDRRCFPVVAPIPVAVGVARVRSKSQTTLLVIPHWNLQRDDHFASWVVLAIIWPNLDFGGLTSPDFFLNSPVDLKPTAGRGGAQESEDRWRRTAATGEGLRGNSLPPGNPTEFLLEMAIYSWFTHEKWVIFHCFCLIFFVGLPEANVA